MNNKTLTDNCRVEWTYKHYAKGRGLVERTKEGIFKRAVWSQYGNPSKIKLAIVRFDGNRTNSRVPIDQLNVL